MASFGVTKTPNWRSDNTKTPKGSILLEQTPKDLIEDVIRDTGLTVDAIAEKMGLKKRTLEKIKWGDVRLTEINRSQLQSIRRSYTKGLPSFGVRKPTESPVVSEEPPTYPSGPGAESADTKGQMYSHYSTPTTALPEILDVIAEGMTPSQIAATIQRLLGQHVGTNPRTMAAEYLNELLSKRIKEHTRKEKQN